MGDRLILIHSLEDLLVLDQLPPREEIRWQRKSYSSPGGQEDRESREQPQREMDSSGSLPQQPVISHQATPPTMDGCEPHNSSHFSGT